MATYEDLKRIDEQIAELMRKRDAIEKELEVVVFDTKSGKYVTLENEYKMYERMHRLLVMHSCRGFITYEDVCGIFNLPYDDSDDVVYSVEKQLSDYYFCENHYSLLDFPMRLVPEEPMDGRKVFSLVYDF